MASYGFFPVSSTKKVDFERETPVKQVSSAKNGIFALEL
jgi:hypothetical protein